jgi:hypothetical protein
MQSILSHSPRPRQHNMTHNYSTDFLYFFFFHSLSTHSFFSREKRKAKKASRQKRRRKKNMIINQFKFTKNLFFGGVYLLLECVIYDSQSKDAQLNETTHNIKFEVCSV